MKISELSVRKPVTTIMLYALLCVLGFIFIPRLGVDLYPASTDPVLSVSTVYEDVGPEEIEENVTKLLESRLSAVSGLESMTSTSSTGRSTVRLFFGYDVDLDEAYNDVQAILSRLTRSLPDGCESPVLRRYDSNASPIMRLTVSGDLPLHELRAVAEDDISPLLERVPGVATVSVSGGAEKIVRVDISENRLRAYNLTLSGVASALRQRNVKTSGGTLTENGIDYQISVDESFRTLDDIRRAVVGEVTIPAYGNSVRRTNVIRVEDIGDVYEMYDFSGSRVYIDGIPGVYISVSREIDANSTTVSRGVRGALDGINAGLPAGVRVSVLSDDTTMIETTMSEVYASALQGGLLAMLIILLFLRSFRSTLVIAFSMPISILITLVCMSIGGLTLNVMTMTGLILGIGMIVDASIVVLDNIHRYREEGKNSAAAAILGSTEMTTAITASTLTTLCVFLPVILYKPDLEEMGQMFGDMVVTIVASLTASLVVALTLVPALCGSVLRLNTRVQKPLRNPVLRFLDRIMEKFLVALENGYAAAVSFVLRNRFLVLLLTVSLCVLSILHFLDLGINFSPQTTSDDLVRINLKMPVGTDDLVTEQVLFQMKDEVESRVSGYETLIVTVGASNTGNIQLNLPPLDQQTMQPAEIEAVLRPVFAGIPGAEVDFSSGRRFRSDPPVDIEIRSDDMNAVSALSREIADVLRTYVPGLVDISSDLEAGLPQFTMHIDRDRAAALGIPVSAVADTLRNALNGVEATIWNENSEEISVEVYVPDLEMSTLNDLNRIYVEAASGRAVSLDNLVSFRRSVSPPSIFREERVRLTHVRAELAPGRAVSQIQPLVEAAVEKYIAVPEGVEIRFAGEAADMEETGGILAVVILVAVVMVFAVMAAQFESLADPFIIFFSIPLLSIGVVWLYVLTGQIFSLFSAVGFVALVGVVVNNGIVLVDYTNSLVRRRMPVKEACVLAARHRLRPILMTTLTTVIAMVPVVFFPGEGSEMLQPITLTMFGGMISGSMMTLFITPVMYSLINGRKEKHFSDPETLENMLGEFDAQKRPF